MRKILLLGFIGMWALAAQAQQGVQYTQFMFNKIGLNPAYAGAHESACLSGIFRRQWAGLEGAPTSQNLNFHTPLFGKRIGLGLTIANDRIGPTESLYINMAYSYRIKVGKGTVSAGFQGGVRNYRVRFQETQAIDPTDQAIPDDMGRRVLPNFGAGLFYQAPQFYAGISVPQFLEGDLSFSDALATNTDFSRERRHYYFMSGMMLDVARNVQLKPAILLKYVDNAPMDLDIHGSLVFSNMIGAGLTYRLGGIDNSVGESLDLVLYLVLASKLRMGMAYDLSLTPIREYQSGTFEVMVEYCLKPKDSRNTNPRFFF